MRLVAFLLLLSACQQLPTYELVGCPASPGWTWRERAALQWEEMQPDFNRRYPKAAQALNEYQDAHADRCILLSGLREYPAR